MRCNPQTRINIYEMHALVCLYRLGGDHDAFGIFQALENPSWVLPVEVLHGFTYAAMWTTSLEHAQNIAPGANQSRCITKHAEEDFGIVTQQLKQAPASAIHLLVIHCSKPILLV